MIGLPDTRGIINAAAGINLEAGGTAPEQRAPPDLP